MLLSYTILLHLLCKVFVIAFKLICIIRCSYMYMLN